MSHRLIAQLARVREEYLATRGAVDYIERIWSRIEPAPELARVDLAHIRRAAGNLEGTYVIRLFAEFEGLLGYHLAVTRRRQRVPRTAEALIDCVALRVRLPNLLREGAHAVREYRNALVHPGSSPVERVAFREASAALNRFLAPLPEPP